MNILGAMTSFPLTAQQIEHYDAHGWIAPVEVMTPGEAAALNKAFAQACLLYTSPSPRDQRGSRMPSSA